MTGPKNLTLCPSLWQCFRKGFLELKVGVSCLTPAPPVSGTYSQPCQEFPHYLRIGEPFLPISSSFRERIRRPIHWQVPGFVSILVLPLCFAFSGSVSQRTTMAADCARMGENRRKMNRWQQNPLLGLQHGRRRGQVHVFRLRPFRLAAATQRGL